LESIYKIDAGSNHVAKFRGDRPRELGDYALKKKKLEVHGRARREAARRRKSEWKVDSAIRNSSRSNGSWRMTT